MSSEEVKVTEEANQVAPEEKKCEPAFTGSFIQSWASGSWTDEQWESETEYMKDCGVEYLIVQDVANKAAEKSGGKWYDMYVDYAVANKIISKTTFGNYEKNITRADLAHLFAALFHSSLAC